MSRKFQPGGVCSSCGHVGATHYDPDATPSDLPELCDRCDYAQRRWDARQAQIRCPGNGYPYHEKPPITPPVRRPGDVALGRDGWPVTSSVAPPSASRSCAAASASPPADTASPPRARPR